MSRVAWLFLAIVLGCNQAPVDTLVPGPDCDLPEPILCFEHGCICPQEPDYCETRDVAAPCCVSDAAGSPPTFVGRCLAGNCVASQCYCEPDGYECVCSANNCGTQQ